MDKIARISFDELETYAQQLADRGDRKSSNDAMVLVQLVASLRVNSERDIIVASMAARLDDLEARFSNEQVLQSEIYQTLVSEFRKLQRQQDDLRARQDAIAAVVDVGIDKISEVARKMERLSESVRDSTEP